MSFELFIPHDRAETFRAQQQFVNVTIGNQESIQKSNRPFNLGYKHARVSRVLLSKNSCVDQHSQAIQPLNVTNPLMKIKGYQTQQDSETVNDRELILVYTKVKEHCNKLKSRCTQITSICIERLSHDSLDRDHQPLRIIICFLIS